MGLRRQEVATPRVIGVAMTSAQLEKVTTLAVDSGIGNVEFRKGYIEAPPSRTLRSPASSQRRCSPPDRKAVFRAAAAALRPRGWLAIADS